MGPQLLLRGCKGGTTHFKGVQGCATHFEGGIRGVTHFEGHKGVQLILRGHNSF